MNAPVLNAKQCNSKLYNALLGRDPSAEELEAPNPLAQVDDMLRSDDFAEYFSSFVNAHMNWGPMGEPQDNPVYAVMRFGVFGRDWPFRDIFLGEYKIDDGRNINQERDRVGYFEQPEWKDRYAGNEEDGYRLRSAYMIMNNVIGLNLDAITVTTEGGSSRADRQAPGSVCYHCHYRFDFALDRVANILTRVDRERSTMESIQYTDAPESASETVFGQEVTGVRSLVEMLVERPEFNVNACAIAFEYVFGRKSGGTESEIFNGCIRQFALTGMIQSAVKHFVESALFCPGQGN